MNQLTNPKDKKASERLPVRNAASIANEVETAYAAVNRAAFMMHRFAVGKHSRAAQAELVKMGSRLKAITIAIEPPTQDEVDADTDRPNPAEVFGRAGKPASATAKPESAGN